MTSKIELTPRAQINLWLDNLDIAQTMMERISDVYVELSWWRGSGDECGTCACFGGHVAVEPAFKAQGIVQYHIDGSPTMLSDDGRNSSDTSPSEVSAILFGDPDMFYSRTDAEMGVTYDRASDEDIVFDEAVRHLTDKETVLRRISTQRDKLLEQLETTA